jgi:hypothetical protein
MSLQPQDESVHEYPKPLDAHWKENWYFNFIDRENNAWGINHVSLMRHKQQGRFSAFHIVDGEVLLYSNVIDIEDELPELTDGKLKFEFVEPFKKFRLAFDGPRHRVELDYDARFEVYDYAGGKPVKPGRQKSLALNHYEQALFCKGKITKGGETREIDCLGHRDHSWGYRNESKVSGWNWIAVQFPERTINMSRVTIGQAFMGNGFISTADGNSRVVRVSVDDTEYENKVPISSVFTGVDKEGKTWKLKSKKFSGLYLPMKEKGEGVVVHENFAEYEDLETGEVGVGIDEYLVNPEM